MSDRTPTLSAMERMLLLRALPALAQLEDQELAAVVHRTSLARFPAGATLLRQGDLNHATYVVAEGRVQSVRDGEVIATGERRIGVGALAMFADARNAASVVAEGDVTVLKLSRTQMIEVLEGHFSILNSILRFIASEVMIAFDRLANDYVVPLRERPAPSYLPSVERDLDLVERILALRRVPAFARSNLDAVAQYALLLEQVYVPAGEVLWEEGEHCANYLHLVHGHVRCVREATSTELRFGPPGMPGFIGALADAPRWYRAEAVSPVVALRADREILPDVLEDNVEMGKRFLAAAARRLMHVIELGGGTTRG